MPSLTTVAGRFDARNNSLNFIRLVLAGLVIVSHSWPLGGFGDDPQLGNRALGRWAVGGFFAISGYLITSSRDHLTLPDFLWRRVLRIYPGFLASLVVVAGLFAPLSTLIGDGSFTAGDALSYVARNSSLHIDHWAVGDTLAGVPYPNVWNGALWTLFYEFLCYVGIGVAFTVLPRKWLPGATIAALVAATAGHWVVPAAHLSLWGVADGLVTFAPFFLAGSVLYLFADRVHLNARWALPAAVAVGLLALAGVDADMDALPLAYLCMWLGVVLPCRSVGRRHDLSYGVYVYGFPVQQTLALLGAMRWGVGAFLALSLALTVPFAMCSWFVVERPALRLKGARLHLPRWAVLAGRTNP